MAGSASDSEGNRSNVGLTMCTRRGAYECEGAQIHSPETGESERA